MGWESSLMSLFDIGKLVGASLLLLVVRSVLVEFTTNAASSRAAHTFGVIPFSLAGFCGVSWPCGVSWWFVATPFSSAVVRKESGRSATLPVSVSFLSTLVGFCEVSFAFVCLPLSFSSAVVRKESWRSATLPVSVSFLPTLVVFFVVSFAFVCLSLSCVVSWPCGGFWPCIGSLGFVATTFSSALVVVPTAFSLSAAVWEPWGSELFALTV